MAIMRQSVCLVINPIMVNSYGSIINCTTVNHGSGFIPNDDPGLHFTRGLVPNVCFWLDQPWLKKGISLPMAVCVLRALFPLSHHRKLI